MTKTISELTLKELRSEIDAINLHSRRLASKVRAIFEPHRQDLYSFYEKLAEDYQPVDYLPRREQMRLYDLKEALHRRSSVLVEEAIKKEDEAAINEVINDFVKPLEELKDA